MRRRLAVLVGATTSLVLIAFLVPLALLVRTVAADRAMSTATAEAQNLVPVAANLDRPALTAYLQARGDGPDDVPLTVYLEDGTAIGEPAPRTDAVRLAQREPQSIVAETADGMEIIVSVEGSSDLGSGVVIRAQVTEEQLRDGVVRAWVILALLGVGILVISLVVADLLGRSLVRSTGGVADVARRLGRGDLDARVEPSGTPELRDVGSALNTLATRIRTLLAAERENVADLSHRVRTPLTVLRIDAESLRNPDEADRMSADVAELERAVNQAIQDARRSGDDREVCDATAVARERLDFWSALAEEEGRQVTSALADHPLWVWVPAQELAACLDALFGNVFAHTGEGVGFEVRLARSGEPPGEQGEDGEEMVALTVTDQGPGMPDPDAVLDRGSSGGGSTGLGLDIARRTAEMSGGRLVLGNDPGGGARVSLLLGRAGPGVAGAV